MQANHEGQISLGKTVIIDTDDISKLIANIIRDYSVVAPVQEKWALNLARVSNTEEIAWGFGSKESPGSYRLERKSSLDLSDARTMNSPKSFIHKSLELLYTGKKQDDGSYTYRDPEAVVEKLAFFGIHACDVHSIHVLDRTFSGKYKDQRYDQRRANALIIGVNCLRPGANCFCSTFNAGPKLTSGFDLALSFLGDGCLVEIGTERGGDLLSGIEVSPASDDYLMKNNYMLEQAKRKMKKSFDAEKARKTLNENYNHPYWQEPSDRCLSCANCINVCPTCYCYQMLDRASSDLKTFEKLRAWDACQHLEFAAVHGGNFRANRQDRIRQWVNHKLNWSVEQYGVAGCVGCGRCITWCPSEIDITEPIWRIGGGGIGIAV